MKPLSSYTSKLTEAQAQALEAHLRGNDFKFREVPYARFAGEKEKTNVVFYESGKLVVQGKGTQDFVEFVLEPLILQEVKLGYETVLNPELLAPRIGVDESGKGDFFGPLCVAGVYINEGVVKRWEGAGIRDFEEYRQRPENRGGRAVDPRHAWMRLQRRAHRRRGLQPAAREDEKRQHAAGVGPCAGHRELDGGGLSHEPEAGAGDQRSVRA